MADDGAVAVAEAPVVDTSSAESSGESTELTGKPSEQKTDKLDGRNQPDALKKRISELRRQADTITDPTQKASLLADAKDLNNRVGKVAAYEQTFPTVREARESKTLIDSFGGREGLVQAQQTLSRVQEIDAALESGDPSAAESLWKEAPQGMVKLAPMIFAELEKNAPQEYDKAVVPHAVKFFDKSGFPEAFDQMVQAYQAGDKKTGDTLSARLANWFSQQRGQSQQQAPKVDPNVERLQKELDDRKGAESKHEVDRAYGDVVSHAGPVIDRFLKPIVAKLGLSKDQYNALREDTWKHLQDTRNADQTYKTVSAAKQRQGMGEVSKYIKKETESRAAGAAKARANFWYGHQLKNGAVATKVNATETPTTSGVTRGKEPSPSEIDYGPKGVQAAKKSGFRDLSEMILSGKAPLKVGGIRQWR